MSEKITNTLPETGFVRQKQLATFIPFSVTTLWRKVRDGEFPKPVKLSVGITAWRAEEVRQWCDENPKCEAVPRVIAINRPDVVTALYRHYNKTGKLLYVGISLKTLQRLGQHRRNSQWFYAISTITIEHLPSRSAALVAERTAVISENPLYNITWNSANLSLAN